MLKNWMRQSLAIVWAGAITLLAADLLFGDCGPPSSVAFLPVRGRTANKAAEGPSQARAAAPRGAAARYGSSVPPADAGSGYYGENGPNPPKAPTDLTRRASVLTVRLPADAELWVDGKKLDQSGNVRTWVTPLLTPEQIYSYRVRSRWVERGSIEVEKSLNVRTFAGSRITVNFVRAAQASPRRAGGRAMVGQRARSRVVERPPITWNAPIP